MATRMQQRKGTAAQWAAADPILNAGEIGWESDTNKFKIGDGTNHWDDLTYFLDATDMGGSFEDYVPLTQKNAANGVAQLNADINVMTKTAIEFEGSTADAYETILGVVDPTEDRVITLPDAGGTIALLTDITVTPSSTTTFTNKTLTSPSVSGLQITDGSIIVEGVTANDFETTLAITDPTADRTITFKDESGTVALATDVDTRLALSGGTMTGAIEMGTSKITGLGDPTSAQDAATKAYVDAIAEGLHIHASVVAATTANITLATDVENGDVLDGVTLVTGDRILVKNQSTASQNGIYVVAASGAPSRATDFDSPAEIDGGDFVFVVNGTANDNKGFVQINTVGTIGTDPIEFSQFSGAGTFTAGTGLTLDGSTFRLTAYLPASLTWGDLKNGKTISA
jgi:hypothetical protein